MASSLITYESGTVLQISGSLGPKAQEPGMI